MVSSVFANDILEYLAQQINAKAIERLQNKGFLSVYDGSVEREQKRVIEILLKAVPDA